MNATHTRGALLGRVWALPLMLAVGVVIAVTIVKSRPPLEHQPITQATPAVRTLPLAVQPVQPSVLGFGQVTPNVVLDMRAEVAGKVTYVHPQLKKGAILPADTLVVKIDDRDYQLALKKARANLAQQQASLAEQRLVEQDTQDDLLLATEKLRLAEAELTRFERLLNNNSIAASAVDSQRSAVLRARQEVQSLHNQLDLIPHSLKVLEAQIEIAEAEVQSQTLNLTRTQIRLPFNARITSQSAESGQFVAQGTSLFAAQTIDKVLINAQLPLQQMRFLSRGFELEPGLLLRSSEDMAALIQRLGLSATVRLAGDTMAIHWDANVERISNNLDPLARTVGVIVSVDRPYTQVQPGVKPPLIEGMYMEVELRGRAQPYWIVPRNALHEGEAYLLDSQQQLQRVALSGHAQGPYLLLNPETPLPSGAQLVTSDLFPAVAGMPLTPLADDAAQAALDAWLETH